MSGAEIRAAARKFAELLNIGSVTTSAGWLFRFYARKGLGNWQVTTESASADVTAGVPFKEKLRKLTEEMTSKLRNLQCRRNRYTVKYVPTFSEICRTYGNFSCLTEKFANKRNLQKSGKPMHQLFRLSENLVCIMQSVAVCLKPPTH